MSMDALKETLKARPTTDRWARRAWTLVARLQRPSQLRRFLRQPQDRWLFLGAGHQRRDGWLASDLLPTGSDAVYLDATKPFPLPDGSVDRILCEHMIEHVAYPDARRLLTECRRVLRPGGRLRLATPNLESVLVIAHEGDRGELQDYVRWSNREFGTDVPPGRDDESVYVINRLFHEWGHRFLYRPRTLERELADAGFVGIVECEVGQSDDAVFDGIDFHGDTIPASWNRLETMAFEAEVAPLAA